MQKVNVGVIGCGNISSTYLKNLTQTFSNTDVVAVADQIPERAQAQARTFGVPSVLSPEALIANEQVQIVLILTTPSSHAMLCRQALEAGKHVHVEKPLAISLQEASRLWQLAQANRLMLGCAPDTFLGAGIQTSLEQIRAGRIGRPIGATAFMACHGHERWHPDPAYYYDVGGGPMFDMGPYYLTSLFLLLGPARRVTGMVSKSFSTREITSEPKRGQIIDVKVPTHVTGTIELESQAVATLLTSFDVWHADLPHLEIYGSEGTLSVPDPDRFAGPVRLAKAGSDAFEHVPLTRPYEQDSRGIGVADMARAILQGKDDFRAGASLGLHVLEAIHGFHLASQDGKHHAMQTSFTSPKPLPEDFRY